MFIRFDMIHKRGRQTDRRTDRRIPHADIGRAYASHRAAKTATFCQRLQTFYCFHENAFTEKLHLKPLLHLQ